MSDVHGDLRQSPGFFYAEMAHGCRPNAFVVAEDLLGGAFVRLDTGDPDGALACAMQALQVSGGPDLAALAQRMAHQTSAQQVCEDILRKGGILVDSGRSAELRAALEGGSSVVCRRCGALVARERMEAHLDHWCPALPESPCTLQGKMDVSGLSMDASGDVCMS
eukprot:TRINITY_DN112428_c0_g1_i1.p1 TRINITY_DN112428_c0_g1~~TRINITY_DN112428_c0_g1_i1.p1  ORF type:complete len:165 (-),score=29.13 TRINITY_DN112428_c0_g1_i1:225-719(-)